MNEPQDDELYDVTEVPYRTKWKVFQNAVYWINLKGAQDNGVVPGQTHSSAMILDNSVPADCRDSVTHLN